jgi:hypothetical protein
VATLNWTYNGLAEIWELFAAGGVISDLLLRLYVNNHQVLVTDLWSALTECTLAGYDAATLIPSDWSITTGTPTGYAVAAYPAVDFVFDAYAGGVTVYGAAVTTESNVLLFGGLLDTPFAVPPGGGTLTLTPTLSVVQA